MNEYNAESVIKFWGGKDAAISLCRSYLDQSLTEEHRQRIIRIAVKPRGLARGYKAAIR